MRQILIFLVIMSGVSTMVVGQPKPTSGQTVTRRPPDRWMVQQIKTVGEFVTRFNGQLPAGADSTDRPATRAQALNQLFDEDDARLHAGAGRGPITYAGRVAQFVDEAADPDRPFVLPRQVRLYAEVDYRVFVGNRPDTLRVWLAKGYTPDHAAYWQVIGLQKPTRLTTDPAPPREKPKPAPKTAPTPAPTLADSVVKAVFGTKPGSGGKPEEPGKTTEKPTSATITTAPTTQTAAPDSTRLRLAPNAHEVSFLPLLRGIIAQKSLLRFAPDSLRPDAGWLAVEAALLAGKLTVETGIRTTLFVDTERGWVLMVNDLNREKDNSGWLITDLADAATADRLPPAIRAGLNLTKR